jgi:ABC-type polysaccharide/polyol phosphate export permease
MMSETARRIWRHRGLLSTLVSRELKARYRGSVLGLFWSFVNPLLLLAVYSFVFGFVFAPRGDAAIKPYALFLVTGLFPWMWISSTLTEGSMSLIANSGLIRKAVFPAELLPTVAALSNGVHFLLALPILGIALIIGRVLGYPVGGWAALCLPAIVLIQLPMVTGLAIGLSALNVVFKDVRDLLINLLSLLFFLTPILYPLSSIPFQSLRIFARLNPFTPFALAYQDALFFNRFPGALLWLQMVVVAAVCWWSGCWLFVRLRETLVEAV